MKNLKVGLMVGLLVAGQGLMAENNSWQKTVTQTSKNVIAVEYAAVQGLIEGSMLSVGLGAYLGSAVGFELGGGCVGYPLDGGKTILGQIGAASGAVSGAVAGGALGVIASPIMIYIVGSESYPKYQRELNEIDLELLKKHPESGETENAAAWAMRATALTAVTVGTVGTVAWLVQQARQK